MPLLWIVDRQPERQVAIARLAAASEDAVSGTPEDPRFDSAPPAEVVLLGLGEDFEAELEFVHRVRPRLPGAGWILLAERSVGDAARRLFDSLDADVLVYPPHPGPLRERIRQAARSDGAAPVPLSQRPARDALSARFARWFADLDLPELLRAIDPRLRDVPLLIQGEPGTGRGLLARYVHAFGGTGGGAFAALPCAEETAAAELLADIASAGRSERARLGCTLWLEDPERLPQTVQRQLRGWIEFGLPEGTLRCARARWIATSGSAAELDPTLRLVLSGISFEVPPLRERIAAVARLANETSRAWCAERGETPRRLGEDALAVLEEYPWPGNLRELEAVVRETLSTGAGDPVRATDLLYGGEALAPLDAGAFGEIVEDGESEPLWPAPSRPAESAPAPESSQPAAAPVGVPVPIADEEAEAVLRGLDPELPRANPLAADDEALRRLVAAVAHEVRNPLSTIRTFAQLLPQRWQDPEFRTRFSELVDQGVLRIEEVVERLAELATLAPPEPEPVDVAECLEELLEEQRDLIHARQLLVLKELDASRSHALGDPAQIRFAFAGIVSKSLALVPSRGDVYFASKHHASGLRGRPSLRVLARFQGAGPNLRVAGTGPAENTLEFVLAEAMIRAQGGHFTIDTTDANETVIVVDLPAPPD